MLNEKQTENEILLNKNLDIEHWLLSTSNSNLRVTQTEDMLRL